MCSRIEEGLACKIDSNDIPFAMNVFDCKNSARQIAEDASGHSAASRWKLWCLFFGGALVFASLFMRHTLSAWQLDGFGGKPLASGWQIRNEDAMLAHKLDDGLSHLFIEESVISEAHEEMCPDEWHIRGITYVDCHDSTSRDHAMRRSAAQLARQLTPRPVVRRQPCIRERSVLDVVSKYPECNNLLTNRSEAPYWTWMNDHRDEILLHGIGRMASIQCSYWMAVKEIRKQKNYRTTKCAKEMWLLIDDNFYVSHDLMAHVGPALEHIPPKWDVVRLDVRKVPTSRLKTLGPGIFEASGPGHSPATQLMLETGMIDINSYEAYMTGSHAVLFNSQTIDRFSQHFSRAPLDATDAVVVSPDFKAYIIQKQVIIKDHMCMRWPYCIPNRFRRLPLVSYVVEGHFRSFLISKRVVIFQAAIVIIAAATAAAIAVKRRKALIAKIKRAASSLSLASLDSPNENDAVVSECHSGSNDGHSGGNSSMRRWQHARWMRIVRGTRYRYVWALGSPLESKRFMVLSSVLIIGSFIVAIVLVSMKCCSGGEMANADLATSFYNNLGLWGSVKALTTRFEYKRWHAWNLAAREQFHSTAMGASGKGNNMTSDGVGVHGMRVALIVTGQLTRLELQSKLESVAHANALAGAQVDILLSLDVMLGLLALDATVGWGKRARPDIAEYTESPFFKAFAESLGAWGESVEKLPNGTSGSHFEWLQTALHRWTDARMVSRGSIEGVDEGSASDGVWQQVSFLKDVEEMDLATAPAYERRLRQDLPGTGSVTRGYISFSAVDGILSMSNAQRLTRRKQRGRATRHGLYVHIYEPDVNQQEFRAQHSGVLGINSDADMMHYYRLWKGWQLLRAAERDRGEEYDLVLQMQDATFVASPWTVDWSYKQGVTELGCLRWGGMHDTAFAVGRPWAHALLDWPWTKLMRSPANVNSRIGSWFGVNRETLMAGFATWAQVPRREETLCHRMVIPIVWMKGDRAGTYSVKFRDRTISRTAAHCLCCIRGSGIEKEVFLEYLRHRLFESFQRFPARVVQTHIGKNSASWLNPYVLKDLLWYGN